MIYEFKATKPRIALTEEESDGIAQITAGFYAENAEDEKLLQFIQGKSVDSKEEARACMALDYLRTDYIYHYEFRGGTQVRGGQVIDILAKTVPLWTPIYIQSEYWHGPTKKYEDTIKIREFKAANMGMFQDPIEIWDYDLTTIDQAIATMRARLNL